MRVTVLGSCRADDPVKYLGRQGRLTIHHFGIYGYTHTTSQHRQLMRTLRGEIQPPPELIPYLTERDEIRNPPIEASGLTDILAAADVLVIEVCARRLFQFNGWHIKDTAALSRLIARRSEYDRWWRRRCRPNPPLPDEFDAPADDLSEAELAVLRETEVRRQTKAEVQQGMREIAADFDGPILWVRHFDARDNTGRWIEERALLGSWVAEGAEHLDQPLFDPAPLIEEAGVGAALLDSAHYRDEFVPAVAERLWSFALRAWADGE